MESLTTPGVYFESLQPTRITGDLLRSDIAAFMGYSQKGPANVPVRIDSWRQFLSIFGDPLNPGHLAPAIKGFFENGGNTCYIVRVVDEHASAAQQWIPAVIDDRLWNTYASFRFGDLVVVEAVETSSSDSALLKNFSPGETKTPIPNAGTWGNRLSVSIERSSRLSTETTGIFNDGFSSFVQSLVGLETYSVVEVSQETVSSSGIKERRSEIIPIESIDPARQVIHWQQTLSIPGTFDPEQPLRIDTVEFDLNISLGDRRVETFRWLGIHPLHSQSLHTTPASNSQFINLEFLGDENTDWHNPDYWPVETPTVTLQGGEDGVAQVSSREYLSALEKLADVDEIGIVAAPDLVLNVPPITKLISVLPPIPDDCDLLLAPKKGTIFGQITDGINTLSGARITDLASGRFVTSNQNGEFTLDNLDLNLRTLRIEKSGFESDERQLLSTLSVTGNPVIISLSPITEPRHLTDDEILTVQQAMANPVLLGSYRVALLDPPAPDYKIEEIRNWRNKIGDSSYTALYYPWLQVTPPETSSQELSNVPPCGHVAGQLAKHDIEVGPHRAAANVNLRYSKNIAKNISEIHHGILNPEHINVIRSLPGQGIRILGARSLSSNSEWRYFNVRRLILALEKTLEQTLQWVVFESNTTVLRQAVTLSINTLLNNLWRNGALAGKTREAAFRVKCDLDNNPASERDNGRLIAEIGVAPSIPFEFIRIRFDRTLDSIEVTE